MVHHMRLFCTCTLLLFPTMLLTCNFILLRHLLLDQLSEEPLLPVDPDTPGSVAECHAVIFLYPEFPDGWILPTPFSLSLL